MAEKPPRQPLGILTDAGRQKAVQDIQAIKLASRKAKNIGGESGSGMSDENIAKANQDIGEILTKKQEEVRKNKTSPYVAGTNAESITPEVAGAEVAEQNVAAEEAEKLRVAVENARNEAILNQRLDEIAAAETEKAKVEATGQQRATVVENKEAGNEPEPTVETIVVPEHGKTGQQTGHKQNLTPEQQKIVDERGARIKALFDAFERGGGQPWVQEAKLKVKDLRDALERHRKDPHGRNDAETIEWYEREIALNQRVVNGEKLVDVLDSMRTEEDKKGIEEEKEHHKNMRNELEQKPAATGSEDASKMPETGVRGVSEETEARARVEAPDTKSEADEGTAEEDSSRNEKLEREKLFQSQIENNSHPRAKSIKENLILFMDSIERDSYNTSISDKFQMLKEELSEVLYRNDIEYAGDKEIKINEEDKGIVQPILDFRKEMDALNPLDQRALTDYKDRLLGYMRDTFGLVAYTPKEGDTLNTKTMKVTKVHGTGVALLDQRIKKVVGSGYTFNDEFLEYYKESQANNKKAMKEKWNSLKGTIPDDELNKIIDEDTKTFEKYSFPTGYVRTAKVETYSSTAHEEAVKDVEAKTDPMNVDRSELEEEEAKARVEATVRKENEETKAKPDLMNMDVGRNEVEDENKLREYVRMRTQLEDRSKEFDAKAEKLGIVEKSFRRLGEKYNKLSLKSKLVIGAGLGLGAAAFTTVSMPVVFACMSGIAVQRIAGLASSFLKYEKKGKGKEGFWAGKEGAMLKAAAYSIGMTLVIGEAVHLASESSYGEAVHEWLKQHYPFGQVGDVGTEGAGASSAPHESAGAGDNVGNVEDTGAGSTTTQEINNTTDPVQKGAPTNPDANPVGNSEVASDGTEIAPKDLSAQEWRAEYAESENYIGAPEFRADHPKYPDAGSADSAVNSVTEWHELTPKEWHDELERLIRNQNAHEVANPDVEISNAEEVVVNHNNLSPDTSPVGNAGADTSHPTSLTEASHAPVAPETTFNSIVNASGLDVATSEPHIYADKGGEHLLVYGGSLAERAQLIGQYFQNPEHARDVVYGADDTNITYRIPWQLVNGETVPGEPVKTPGVLGFFKSFMEPPQPDELRKLIQ